MCGFITPWNWPMNQIACKVAPALAVGCTMVLKPSKSPRSARSLRRNHARRGRAGRRVQPGGRRRPRRRRGHREPSGYRHGVVHRLDPRRRGRGPQCRRRRSSACTRNLAASRPTSCWKTPTWQGVPAGVANMMSTPASPATRPAHAGAPPTCSRGRRTGEGRGRGHHGGRPRGNAKIGPVVSEVHWNKIQGLIRKGIEEGATLVTGGPGKPEAWHAATT